MSKSAANFSTGQLPLALPELGAAFVGINLHKWVGAPVGVGLFYIRSDRLERIAPAPGETARADRIDSRIHTGTTSFAAILTVPDALDFQDSIGAGHPLPQQRTRADAARQVEALAALARGWLPCASEMSAARDRPDYPKGFFPAEDVGR